MTTWLGKNKLRKCVITFRSTTASRNNWGPFFTPKIYLKTNSDFQPSS